MDAQAVMTPVTRPMVRVWRRLSLEQVQRDWPDKFKIANYLANNLDTLSRECPMISRQALFGHLATFGLKVSQAQTPQVCIDAFTETMKHLACPEPGWDAVDLVFED